MDRPGRPEGATDAIVELLDLYPTLAALAGLPAPAHTQGTSVRYLFDDVDAEGKEAAYSQFIRNADRTYTTYPEAVAMGQAVRTDRYRLIRWITRGAAPDTTIELYDQTHDPRETMNRAGEAEYADVVDRLTGLADARFKTPFP
jgi:arylsulfatase A-like enzyme